MSKNIEIIKRNGSVEMIPKLCISGNSLLKVQYLIDDYNDPTIQYIDEDILLIKEIHYMVDTLKKNVKVLCMDINTNQLAYKTIQASFLTNPSAKVLKITVDGNNQLIITPDHKIWNVNLNQYVKAENLIDDDKVLLTNYSDDVEHNFIGTITTIEELSETIPVYDITVQDNSNYYACEDNNYPPMGILIHNCL